MPDAAAGAAWESRLQAALGDDTALLELAIEAPSVDHKLSAVLAMASEDVLRAAEREFRKHDRRVHSVAKQRYEALVKQRETRATAAELIQAAAALVETTMIPANRLVELNQAWELLDSTLIDHEEKIRFTELQSGLAELMRQRSERKRAGSRWTAAAKQALADLDSAYTGVATAGADPLGAAAMLAQASEKARAALAALPARSGSLKPEDGAIAALGEALQAALRDSPPIEARLVMLNELHEFQSPQNAVFNSRNSGPASSTLTKAAVGRWQGLPPIAGKRVEEALNARFEEWLHLQDEARQKLQSENRLRVSEKVQAAQHKRNQALTEAADTTEAALAEGHLAEAGKHLTILQNAAGEKGASAALQTRIGALQAEFLRLKDWQHWGGGRVRDDLV